MDRLTTKTIIFSLLSLTSIVTLASSVNAQNLVPLELYWNPQREDNFSTANPEGGNSAIQAGYNYVRVEACVFPTQEPGTVPLNLYWSPDREDNFTTVAGGQDARVAKYFFMRTEGYVYPDQREGTIPLTLYWNAFRGDNFTTATDVGIQSAQQAGYSFARVEGYVYPASACR
jgi:hypothetical protein